MGAPLDVACRSSLLLRSAETLSTTLLGFGFLQRPQHVLSNLLHQPHASVWAGSSTISFFLRLSLGTFLGPFHRLRPLPSDRQFVAPWAYCRDGRRSRSSCHPHIPCNAGGHVHGCSPCCSRPINRCAVICTRGTRAAGSRSSAVPCRSWSLGPGGSTWTCPAHAPLYCALRTQRSGLLHDPLRWSGSRDLGRFHSLPPRCRPCPPGPLGVGDLPDDLNVHGPVDPSRGPRSWR